MTDCLIVGGGVVGLSLAFELAGHGLRIEVLDRQQPGREASWAGAGILPPASPVATHPYEQLAYLSWTLHPQWAAVLREETDIDTQYEVCGGLYLARTPGAAASLAGYRLALQQEQVRVQPVELEQLVKLEPALAEPVRLGNIRAACQLPDEAQLRNPRHLEALQQACRHRGVIIRGDTEVHAMPRSGRKIAHVETSAGRVSAGCYVLTAGAWTYRLLEDLGVRTGILPVRGQMVLFRCRQRPIQHILNEGARYVVPRRDGRVLVGSTEEEVGFDKSTTDEGIEQLVQFGRQLVPALREAPIERCWAGLRPGSFDGFPYLGRLPESANGYVAAGHFRTGLTLSPGTAVVLGQLIRGQTPQIDLSPFRVGRG